MVKDEGEDCLKMVTRRSSFLQSIAWLCPLAAGSALQGGMLCRLRPWEGVLVMKVPSCLEFGLTMGAPLHNSMTPCVL